MKIAEIAYELYKLDWMKRISRDMEMDVVRNYWNEIIRPNSSLEDYVSLENYISDTGYGNGDIYACQEEFLTAEYLDVDYMQTLFNNECMCREYLEERIDSLFKENMNVVCSVSELYKRFEDDGGLMNNTIDYFKEDDREYFDLYNNFKELACMDGEVCEIVNIDKLCMIIHLKNEDEKKDSYFSLTFKEALVGLTACLN